eukprot:733791-Prymnesium_polylepis.1
MRAGQSAAGCSHPYMQCGVEACTDRPAHVCVCYGPTGRGTCVCYGPTGRTRHADGARVGDAQQTRRVSRA